MRVVVIADPSKFMFGAAHQLQYFGVELPLGIFLGEGEIWFDLGDVFVEHGDLVVYYL